VGSFDRTVRLAWLGHPCQALLGCCAGLVLLLAPTGSLAEMASGASRRHAEAASVPLAEPGGPARAPRLLRAAPASGATARSIAVKPLDLAALPPAAFADWDADPR
jgi:hypothetical protein